MSTLLVPVQLDALVLTSSMPVPALQGAPFATESTLQPGVHLSWALPDALTRVRAGRGEQDAQCPGVPDRWLVVRMGAPTTSVLLGRSLTRRAWRAWVVESDQQRVAPLTGWTPSRPGSGTLLTARGLLPQDRPGWGALGRARGEWEPWKHGYYPSICRIFGMHDDLSDLSDRAGPLSYVVVGWYSEPSRDPLASAADPAALCEELRWMEDPPWVEVSQRIGLMEPGPPVQGLVCHGAVLGVDPAAPRLRPPRPTVSVHSTLPRAIAERVNPTPSGRALVELLVHGLDQQLASPGEVLELAYEAHQQSFESRGGEPGRWFAQVQIQSDRAPRPPQLDRAGLRAEQAEAQRGLAAALALPDALREALRQAQERLHAARRAAGLPPVHPRLVRVVDERDSSGAPWWLDLDRRTDLLELLRRSVGAARVLQDLAPVHTVPAPRWWRGRAPVVLVQSGERGTRHGQDGRFDAGGRLQCRRAGQEVRGLEALRKDCPASVAAHGLLLDTGALQSRGVLPAAALELVEEAVLLDPASAPLLASAHTRVQPLPSGLSAVDLTTWYRAALKLLLAHAEAAAEPLAGRVLRVMGRRPGPVGLQAWVQPWCPLLLDTRARVKERASGPATSVEGTLAGPTGRDVVLQERCLLLPSFPRILHDLMFERHSAGPDGRLKPALPAPLTHTRAQVQELDVLAAHLATVDDAACTQGWPLLAGDLELTQARIVDSFGQVAPWVGRATCELAPRPSSWTRVRLQLQDAARRPAEEAEDADLTRSCIAGFLVPNLLEHSLLIYDGEGEALGQIRGDPPVVQRREPDGRVTTQGGSGGGTLKTWFDWFPWVDNPSWQGRNPNLATLVEGLVASVTVVPSAELAVGEPWRVVEPAVSGLLRVLDTARTTVSQRRLGPDHRWGLSERPIVLVRAAAWVERLGRAGDGSWAPVAPPTLHLRLGDLRFASDGLLGRLVPDRLGRPEHHRFLPVDPRVAQQALLNVLPEARQDPSALGALASFLGHATPILRTAPVRVPFVDVDQDPILPVGADPAGLLLLMEPAGAVRGVSGAVPVQHMTLPSDLLQAALSRLQRCFAVGPVLSAASMDEPPTVCAPALKLPGSAAGEARWVHDDGGPWCEEALPQVRKDNIPRARVRLGRGWVRGPA